MSLSPEQFGQFLTDFRSFVQKFDAPHPTGVPFQFQFPPFDGQNTSVQKWFSDAERILRLKNVSATLYRDCLYQSLTGIAKAYADMLPQTLSYEEFKHQFQERFKQPNEHLFYRHQLNMLRLTNGDLAGFIAYFHDLAAKIPDMSEQDRLYYFLQGLPPDMQAYFLEK